MPITAGAPIIASGPVEPESLSKEAGGETYFSPNGGFFFAPK